MERLGRCLLLLPLFLGPFEAARAADADPDLRCMAVMAKINQLPDARHKLESLIGGYYYLGRLNAAAPDLDLGKSVAEAYAKMSAADFLSETTRCEKEMRDKGHAIVEIGNAMPKPPQGNTAPPPPAEAPQGPGLPAR
jgi:hypothetical protein